MARPTRHNADFFSHYATLRDDRRIKAIRSRFGAAGYGVLIMLLETLTSADHIQLSTDDLELELLAGDFGVSVTEIDSLIQLAEKVGYFARNEAGMLICPDLNKALEAVFEKRNRARNAAQSAKPAVIDSENGVSVTETIQSVTENTQSKEKKSKEEKSINRERESTREEVVNPEDEKRLEYERFCKEVDGYYLECTSTTYQRWAETSAKSLKDYGIRSLQQFYAKVDEFRYHIQSTGENHRDGGDFRSHVVRWIRTEFQKTQRNPSPQRNAVNPQSPPPGVSMYAKAGIPD